MINNILLLIRTLMLAISCYGYIQHFKKKVELELTIALLFSFIGSAMFVAGIFAIMVEAAWLIFAVGLYFFWISLKEKSGRRDFFTPGIIFFLLLSAFFAMLLFESRLVHYDNFSHWGTAARILSKRDNFPNMGNRNIIFGSYPLGSASFIFYFTKIIGIAPEWLQTWSQAILMAGMLTSLFAFGHKIEHVLLSFCGIIMLLSSNINFVDLLVDTLLPVVAIGTMAFCIYYKDDLDSKMWYIVPYTVFLLSIKNSATLFVILVLGYIYIHLNKEKVSWKAFVMHAVILIGVQFFWRKHVHQAFDLSQSFAHDMSVSHYKDVISGKTLQDITGIFLKYVDAVFSLSNPAVYALGVMLLLWVFCKYHSDNKPAKIVLIFSTFSYAVYMIGLLGMYFFSMSLEEAVTLAGFDRYHKSIIIFVVGLLYISALLLFPLKEKHLHIRLANVFVVIIILILSFAALQPAFGMYRRQNLEGTERARYDYLIDEYSVPMQEKYLILVDEKEAHFESYLEVMAMSLFDAREVSIQNISSVSEHDWMHYTVIIAYDETEEIMSALNDHFATSGTPVLCMLE